MTRLTLDRRTLLGAATAGMGLAFGTDLGTLEETWKFLVRLRDKGPALANPADFPNLVPNAGPGYVGIFLGLDGPSHHRSWHAGFACAGGDGVSSCR